MKNQYALQIGVFIRHVALLSLLFAAPLNAQSIDHDDPIGLLPSASAGAPLRIDGGNLQEFKPLIVPELYQTVRNGSLELYAVRDLEEEPAAPPGLNASAALRYQDRMFLERGLLDVHFNLFVLKDALMARQFGGRLVRFHPRSLLPEDKTSQLFREIIRVDQPAVIGGFTWLTFRFEGDDQDLLWLFSPVNGKGRELTGTNRSDGLLKTSLTPNDVFGWSSKSDPVGAEKPTVVDGFAYFAEARAVSTVSDGGCESLSRESGDGEAESDGTSRWNFSTRRAPRAAGWLPLEAVLVPRKLLRFELESRDPYSLYGRQVLYLDAVTGAPVYKFVFDRAGKPWKSVIAGVGLKKGADGQVGVYPAFTIVDDFQSGEPVIFDANRLSWCTQFPQPLALADFDPRHFGDWNKPEPAVSPSPEPTPSAAASTSGE